MVSEGPAAACLCKGTRTRHGPSNCTVALGASLQLGSNLRFFLHVKVLNLAKQCDLNPARCPELQEKNNMMSLFS